MIVGMLCVVMEETEGIIGERRLSVLRDLASDIAGKNVHTEVFGVIQRQPARRHDANWQRRPANGVAGSKFFLRRDMRAMPSCMGVCLDPGVQLIVKPSVTRRSRQR